MSHDVIFEAVSKKYAVRPPDTAGGRGMWWRHLAAGLRRANVFWALRNVSFQVNRGEALGIIGHNGAGKSTVLKLLSRITSPSEGSITIVGRLSALIEVGSGFHPELSGRENVYLSGSILGMRRKEIARKLESIVDFAGVRTFIDTPVKQYSSGMYVRLGFAIAAHLEPHVLLLDEVLAVGDAAFQTKCLQRIEELRRGGTTIVFISHDLRAVERLCQRAVLLHRGELMTEGATGHVIAQYERSAYATSEIVESMAPVPDGSAGASITAVLLVNPEGQPVTSVCTGESLTVRVSYFARTRLDEVVFEIFFMTVEHRIYCQLRTDVFGDAIVLEPGEGEVELSCDAIGMQPGVYSVDARISRPAVPVDIDFKERCALVRVEAGVSTHGDFYMPHRWRFNSPGPGVSRADERRHAIAD